MQVRILGPVTAGDEQRLSGLRRKAVLATLALHPGTVVGVDRIIELVWAADGAAIRANTVQQHVSYLRTVLAAGESGSDAIDTVPPGYRLRARTDLVVAEEHIRAGRAADRAEVAARHFRAALDLWRGPSLADVAEVTWLREQGRRLDTLRLDAHVELIEARLRLGEHREVRPELEALAAEHPFGERIHGQLMTALYRTAGADDALAAYDRLCRALDEELGIRPGPDLRRLATAIRERDASLEQRPTVRPAQVPAPVRGFTGRATELAHLDALLDDPAATVVAVWGTGGVGKTALTVAWAHRAAPRFPDGQLYCNLRGFDPAGAPVDAAHALAGFLEALGVAPSALPEHLEARAGLFRGLVAGRRMLILLDNARDAAQVRPLLPGAGGSLVVITSRNRIAADVADPPDAGARELSLDVLPPPDARELLRHRLGHPRTAADPGATDEIIARCAGLPLALSVVAAHAAARPGVTLGELAGQLADAARAWAVLDGGDPVSDVRAVLSWSYLALPPDARRLFRLLGACPGPDLSLAAGASLAGLPPERAGPLFNELGRANLLIEHRPGRYTHHDLLRGYARDLAGAEGDDGARHRVLDHRLRTAIAAAVAINPSWPATTPPPVAPGVAVEPIADPAEGQRWLTGELPVLLATIDAAAAHGFDVHAWQLAWALTDLLERHGRWDAWELAHTAGLRAAERLGDPSAVAHLHRGLGRLRMWQQRNQESHGHLERALHGFTALGDRPGQARTEHNLCQLAESDGRLSDAVAHARRSLDLSRALGDRPGIAKELNALGWCLAALGDFAAARTACEESAAMYREFDDPAQEGSVQHSLGDIYRQLGDLDAAVARYRRALELATDTGDRYAEAVILDGLGDARLAQGDGPAARHEWELALTILTELGHPDAEAVGAKLRTD